MAAPAAKACYLQLSDIIPIALIATFSIAHIFHKCCLQLQLCVHACAGICPHKKVVCLVVDECHRAKGNSDVVLAVKKLREEKCKFRVLGLSATPGSSNEAIQVCRCLDPLFLFCYSNKLHTFHVLLLAFDSVSK